MSQVGHAVPNIALTKCPRRFQDGLATIKFIDSLRYIEHACPFTGTDVHCMTPNRIPHNTGSGRPDDIVNIYEIAALSAIFEYVNRTPCPCQVGKDGKNTGIRILQRLTWSVDVLKT